jgi:hypothetical protein
MSRTGKNRIVAPRRLKGRILSVNIAGAAGNQPGYPTVALGAGNTHTVHTLMALAFLGPPEGRQVRHLNGDYHDNRLENLAYGTGGENMQDMVMHGTQWQQAKEVCPAGHLLAAPNLVAYQLGRGHRSCLACARTHWYLRNHPELDFQTEADRRYLRIMSS